MRVTVSPAMQPKVFLHWMLSILQLYISSCSRTVSEYAAVHIVRLGRWLLEDTNFKAALEGVVVVVSVILGRF